MKKSTNDLTITVVVCGTFHFRQYINTLAQTDTKGYYFFSDKISFLKTKTRNWNYYNIFFKEYSIHFIYRFLSKIRLKRLKVLIHNLWQKIVILFLSESDIFHVLVHGNTDKIVNAIRNKYPNAIIIGEAVNTHPDTFLSLVNQSRKAYGLSDLYDIEMGRERMLNEIKSLDWLLTGSTFIAESYVANGFNPARIKVIPYSTSLDIFKKLPNRPNLKKLHLSPVDFRILFVGQISPRKGIKYLLEAFSNISHLDVELILIGRIDPEIDYILLDESIRCTHLQGLSHYELVEFYNIADVTVLPSVEDGFGYVIKESLACETPVICTSNCGGKDLIDHGINGLIIPPFNSEELTKALLNILENPLIIRPDTSSWSWSDYVQDLIKFYRYVSSS